jgi:hypothetical protein
MPKSLTECVSYFPGHQVHWIQAKVKQAEPRYDAEVEVLSDNKLKVSYQGQTRVFSHHCCDQIQAVLGGAVLGYIKFAPTAQLLYVQTEVPNGQHNGAYSLSYLCDGDLTDCSSPYPKAISISDIELED